MWKSIMHLPYPTASDAAELLEPNSARGKSSPADTMSVYFLRVARR
jgi:hypothetical protein